MKDALSFARPCIICGDDAQPAPTTRAWFTIAVNGSTKRIHIDCAEWLKGRSDMIKRELSEQESGTTPRALDLRESAPFQSLSTPEVYPLAEVEQLPPANQ